MCNILITGGRSPVALELARHFARRGDKVFAADSAPLFLAQSSRAVFKSFRVPPPRSQPRAFVLTIRRIVEREDISMVIPTCEEVFYLARFADLLRPVTSLFCAEFDGLDTLHNKWHFSQLTHGMSIRAPETFLLETAKDIEPFWAHADNYVFKPAYSRFAVHTLIGPAAKALDSLSLSAEYPWVAQRLVQGQELCSYAVAVSGKLTAHALYRPVWRAGQASSFYFEAVERPAIQAFTAELVERLNYTGQIGFDFIEDANGEFHVLECNPRATSGMHLFGNEDNLAMSFTHQAQTSVNHPSSGPRMLGLAMILFGLPSAVRANNLRILLKDFRRARDVLWDRADPLPALLILISLAGFIWRGWRTSLGARAASTIDLEWDGEAIP